MDQFIQGRSAVSVCLNKVKSDGKVAEGNGKADGDGKAADGDGKVKDEHVCGKKYFDASKKPKNCRKCKGDGDNIHDLTGGVHWICGTCQSPLYGDT